MVKFQTCLTLSGYACQSQQQLMNDELKIWNITGEKRKKALAVLNQDITKMNRQQEHYIS
ncbi:hypothetical protein EQG56_00005 [Limosilactobacillus fermentum]|uniref:hypothetical protein n=1 Tax=Limosilactobacillus fermentum TaxID=1613 RepID=UPI000FECB4ED|nr:hypothetical protein [Limosilactobacillus fermentum]QAR22998.1 hypothetical protein EQG56_00005 [Limosilactobacillus fermentum]